MRNAHLSFAFPGKIIEIWDQLQIQTATNSSLAGGWNGRWVSCTSHLSNWRGRAENNVPNPKPIHIRRLNLDPATISDNRNNQSRNCLLQPQRHSVQKECLAKMEAPGNVIRRKSWSNHKLPSKVLAQRRTDAGIELTIATKRFMFEPML